jgi:voltage-dependent calcium channel T type alpha-1G
MAGHAYYESFNYFVIVINSIILMINDPQMKDVYGIKNINNINIVCSIIFIVEVTVKVIAMGFCKGRHTYLKSDGFNVFDFILVVAVTLSLIIQLIYENHDYSHKHFASGVVPAIRALKAMRPLRLARSPLLADTVSSLMGALPNLGNAALINLLFIYIFSILGV